MNFKIDTGADVTVIDTANIPKGKYPLCKADRKLYGPGRNLIPVLGKFTAKLKLKQQNTESIQEVYVVEKLEQSLLGRPAIEAMKLIYKVNTVNVISDKYYRQNHPKLFKGLGKLKDTYKIRLSQDAKPFAVCAPRRVPIPLQQKVEKELLYIDCRI
ncbi:uncharacterized protein [Antedon mediterranea]|uniref:uncharacterized protein n=1 Tax=Antedon mediterranea TaxID=105859 RepID=UPI003AF83661